MTQRGSVAEALVVLDVITTFEHDDGDRLLESMSGLRSCPRARSRTRAGDSPVVYVNDAAGDWDGDAPRRIEGALAGEAAMSCAT